MKTEYPPMQFLSRKSEPTTGRWLAVWLGSFVLVASLLYYHFGVPLFPIALAGGITLVVTAIRYFHNRRTHSQEKR